jgi:uncharacterized protein YbaR (Trm112 family)
MNLRRYNPMITDDVLNLLVCPESKQRLRFADSAIVERLKKLSISGELVTIAGSRVNGDFEAVLLREDGAIGYLVRGGIPILLVEQGVGIS